MTYKSYSTERLLLIKEEVLKELHERPFTIEILISKKGYFKLNPLVNEFYLKMRGEMRGEIVRHDPLLILLYKYVYIYAPELKEIDYSGRIQEIVIKTLTLWPGKTYKIKSLNGEGEALDLVDGQLEPPQPVPNNIEEAFSLFIDEARSKIKTISVVRTLSGLAHGLWCDIWRDITNQREPPYRYNPLLIYIVERLLELVPDKCNCVIDKVSVWPGYACNIYFDTKESEFFYWGNLKEFPPLENPPIVEEYLYKRGLLSKEKLS